MSDIILELTRNGVVENTIRGHAVMADKNGFTTLKGDPDRFFYLRSTGKLLQVLPLLMDGIDKHFGFNEKEIALMCASHYGEPEHIETVKSILNKIGLDETAIKAGITNSISAEYAAELLCSGTTLSTLHGDCSGKHAGMLAYCIYHNLSIEDYLDVNHPMQQRILNVIAEMADFPSDQIVIGLDGCSAPNFALPLSATARAYQRLTSPNTLIEDENLKQACLTVCKSVSAEPFMISGTKGFCTLLIESTKGRIIGKTGAEAIFGLGFTDKEIGMAFKVECGNKHLIPNFVVSVLKSMNLLLPEELEAMSRYDNEQRYTDNKEAVGVIRYFE
ncbi:MAG: asparaginase [Gammaproteobacteria bacterium]